jgi:hypothetical protein
VIGCIKIILPPPKSKTNFGCASRKLAAASPHQSIGDKDHKRGVKLQNITSGVTAPCGIVTSPPTVAKDTFHFELQTHRKTYELMGSIRAYVFSHDIQPTIDR